MFYSFYKKIMYFSRVEKFWLGLGQRPVVFNIFHHFLVSREKEKIAYCCFTSLFEFSN